MVLRLRPSEICPYSEICPFAERHDKLNYCRGTVVRKGEFICRYADEDKLMSREVLSRENRRVSKKYP
jgi:hypothetical protein